MSRRRLAVFTSGRQDFAILRSTLLALRDDPRFELQLLVAGMHLAREHGATVTEIEAEGLPIAERLESARQDPVEEASVTTLAVAGALRRLRSEALLLVGDRGETAAAALAAALERVPLVHLHGGEESEGAVDNVLRHAITKLAHLHLVSHQEHARRVIQMGEDPAAVQVVGAPGLDNLRRAGLPGREALERDLGLSLRAPVIVVTHHPATLGDDPAHEARALLEAMASLPARWVITLPNSDQGSAILREALSDFARRTPDAVAVDALGATRFAALLHLADVMLGNSSSAIIEAPLLGLPAVNVGDRQRGRLRGGNVIDARPDAASIRAALTRALDPAFRALARAAESPFGDGRSAARVIDALAAWRPPVPPRKRFVDAPEHGR